MEKFIANDKSIMQPFFSTQPGFLSRSNTILYYDTFGNASTAFTFTTWESYAQYKGISETDYEEAVAEIEEVMGYKIQPEYYPDTNGLRLLASNVSKTLFEKNLLTEEPAIEALIQSVLPGDMAKFGFIDAYYWTNFLRTQNGFQGKINLIPYFDNMENGTTCYQFINWESQTQWKSINEDVSDNFPILHS